MGWKVRGSNPGSSCQKRRHRLWSPPNRGSSPDVERPGHDVDSQPSSSASGAIPVLPLYAAIAWTRKNFLLLIHICKRFLVILPRVHALQCLSGWHTRNNFTDWGYSYRFSGFHGVCWQGGSRLGLSTTCVLTLYVEAACSFHNTGSGPRILAPYTLIRTGSVSVRTD